jgi:hypothetical protein
MDSFQDQTCLEKMYESDYHGAKSKIKIIDHRSFQGPQDGGFIFHMAGTKDKKEIEDKFREILTKMKAGS